MKIAIMAPLVTAIREPQLGGSQAFVSDLARGLAGRGHEVHVYAASGSEIPGVTVVDTGADPRALAGTLYRAGVPAATAQAESAGAAAEAAFATAYARMLDASYDVIHNHAFDAPAVRLATTVPVPALHTLHLPPDETLAAALDQAARSGRPPVVATVSAFQAAAWRRVVRIDEVLPPYVPTRAIPYSATAGNGAVYAGRSVRKREPRKPSTSRLRPGCPSTSTATRTTRSTHGTGSRRGRPGSASGCTRPSRGHRSGRRCPGRLWS